MSVPKVVLKCPKCSHGSDHIAPGLLSYPRYYLDPEFCCAEPELLAQVL